MSKKKTKAKKTQTTQTKKRLKASEKINIYAQIKYDDIGAPLDSGRLNQFWNGQDIIPLYPRFRIGGKELPNSFKYWDHRYLMQHFGLRGWEFGNWLSQEDRLNYVCASAIALFDLHKVLGIPASKMGLKDKITMAIGARGQTNASAHFEPSNFAINLTRYRDNPSEKVLKRYPFLRRYPKVQRFLGTGGAGALAHEYGHALDYFYGGYVDQSVIRFALSDGDSIRTRTNLKLITQKSMRGQMERILDSLIWDKKGKKTKYYEGIRAYMKKANIKSTYFIRRNELFARAFEQYVGYKLEQKGMSNAFLTKAKYERAYYMDQALLIKVAPKITRLITMMRTYFKTRKK